MTAVPFDKPFVRRHPLLIFVVLAYVFSWGLSFFAVPDLMPFPTPPPLAALARFLCSFGPALAGVIAAAGLAGRAGLQELFGSLGRWRVKWYWYLLVAGYPIGLQLVAIWIGTLLGVEKPPFFNSAAAGLPAGNPLVMAAVAFIVAFVLTGLGQEIGWRGFALPILQDRYSPLAATLIVAALSAHWYFNPLGVQGIRPFVPWHVVSVFATAIVLTFIYNSTGGNLLMVALFQGFAGFSEWLAPTNPLNGGDVITLTVQTGLNLAVAVVVILVFGAQTLAVKGLRPHIWPRDLL